jgi:hypothetical protein
MEGVYKKFQEEHGLSNVKPKSFSVRSICGSNGSRTSTTST